MLPFSIRHISKTLNKLPCSRVFAAALSGTINIINRLGSQLAIRVPRLVEGNYLPGRGGLSIISFGYADE
jgi:hypothetical protein